MRPRLQLVAVITLAALCVSACGPDHHHAVDFTGASLTPDKGEIKGVLTQQGRPGSSAQAVQGKVDVYTLGGNQVADISPVSAWDFELKPGTYNVQAAVKGITCGPIKVKVLKATVQVVDLVCPATEG